MSGNGPLKMDRIDINIRVEIPSLDRYINYLEGKGQNVIDALTARLKAANSANEKANSELQQVINDVK